MSNHTIDFPKIKSPFVRKKIDGHYVVTPSVEEGYEWVFKDEGVKAVDKLHGTNICITVENGRLVSVDNRATRIMSSPSIEIAMSTGRARIIQGIIAAIERKYLKNAVDGRIYGELIGETINGNIHGIARHIFVPFDYLQSKCHWRSWISGDYPKTYDAISEWFKDLPSLYSDRIEADCTHAEGLMFYHPDGRMAKLRRDMFPWYYE